VPEWGIKMKKSLKVLLALLVVFLVVPALCDAANTTLRNETAAEEIDDYIGSITALITKVGGTIGLAVLSVGGVMFMVSSENPAQRDQAKNIIKMGLVGTAILVLAPAIIAYLL